MCNNVLRLLQEDVAELPELWCQQLLSEGTAEALLDIEASHKQSMAPKVQRILRVHKIAAQISDEKQTHAVKVETWDNKHHVKEGLGILVDVTMVKAEWKGDFPVAFGELHQLALQKVQGSMTGLQETLLATKDSVKEVYERADKLRPALPNFDFGEVMEHIDWLNGNEEALKSAVAGQILRLLWVGLVVELGLLAA